MTAGSPLHGPTTFFHAREVDTNLGYVWYRKDDDTGYGIGVKQADHEDDPRYLENYSLYNAPPGTRQRMATYFYVSPGDSAAARESVLAFTHHDTFAPVRAMLAGGRGAQSACNGQFLFPRQWAAGSA